MLLQRLLSAAKSAAAGAQATSESQLCEGRLAACESDSSDLREGRGVDGETKNDIDSDDEERIKGDEEWSD
jgi:hypothetical protein